MVTQPSPLVQRFGQSRYWDWQGWTLHYTYHPSPHPEATPIVLVHGFGASSGHWRYNGAPIGLHRPVYSLDLLGYGASVKPQVQYTMTLWATLLIDFIHTHAQLPVIVMGHSVGALIGLLAAHEPQGIQCIRGLCLISCADGPHPDDLPQPLGCVVQGLFELVVGIIGFPLTYPLLFRWLRQPQVLRGWIQTVYRRKEAVDDELVEIFRQPAFDDGAEYVFLDAFRAVLTRRFEAPQRILPHLHQPILLVWGQEDPAIPSFLADKFKQWQPRITLVKLAGVGHCAHDELPVWVNALVCEWTASLEQDPGYTQQSMRPLR